MTKRASFPPWNGRPWLSPTLMGTSPLIQLAESWCHMVWNGRARNRIIDIWSEGESTISYIITPLCAIFNCIDKFRELYFLQLTNKYHGLLIFAINLRPRNDERLRWPENLRVNVLKSITRQLSCTAWTWTCDLYISKNRHVNHSATEYSAIAVARSRRSAYSARLYSPRTSPWQGPCNTLSNGLLCIPIRRYDRHTSTYGASTKTFNEYHTATLRYICLKYSALASIDWT